MIPKNIKDLEWLKSFNMIRDLEKTVVTQVKSENSVREIQRGMQLKVWKVNGARSEIFLASVKLLKVRDSCARLLPAFCWPQKR